LKPKFEVRFTPRFSRKIGALSREVQVRIVRDLKVLRENPYAGKPLHGEWKNKNIYSLRIGDYRVLYQIKGYEVFLLTVGHRKHIYQG